MSEIAATAETVTPPSSSTRPRSRARRVLGGLFSVLLVVAIFAFLIPKMSSVSFGDAAALITVSSVIVTQALGLVHLWTNWRVTVASLPGLTVPQAGTVGLSGAAISNTLPEGGAFGTALTYTELHSWGFRVDAITASILTTGVFGQLVRYGIVAVGLVGLTFTDSTGWQSVAGALIVVVLVAAAVWIFAMIIRAESFAARLGRVGQRIVGPPMRLIHKATPDLTGAIVGFREKLAGLVSARWRRLTIRCVLSELSAILILGVALRMMGVPSSECSWARVMVAYGGMEVAEMFVPTPGGVGVAEASLLAILGANVPSSQDGPIIAAIILYRAATWLQATLLGVPAYVVWRFKRSWRHPTGERPVLPA